MADRPLDEALMLCLVPVGRERLNGIAIDRPAEGEIGFDGRAEFESRHAHRGPQALTRRKRKKRGENNRGWERQIRMDHAVVDKAPVSPLDFLQPVALPCWVYATEVLTSSRYRLEP